MFFRLWIWGALASIAGLAHVHAARELPEHVPGEVIIRLQSGPNSAHALQAVLNRLQNRMGTSSVLSARELAGATDFQTIRIAHDAELPEAIALLNQDQAVEYAEPNFIYRATEVEPSVEQPVPATNDTHLNRLWGMSDQGIHAFPVWQAGRVGSRSIKVAVIDSGIEYTHPDLQDNILVNLAESGEFAQDGIDNDGNGFIDDTYGWDFANNRANGMDDRGHGTHCAGTIGATGNNSLGVVGVNWQVSLLPVKYLDEHGRGTTAGAIRAIRYALARHVDVMSNSWGGGGFSNALFEVIQETNRAGIVFVASAGNSQRDNDVRPSYPASYDSPNIISVASYASNGTLSTFSNYGATSVHVAAPGTAVFSTFLEGTYRSMNGTSMAAPHVSGMVALLKSVENGLGPEEIRDRLIQTSRPSEALAGKTVSGGQVDLERLLR